jgi:hypothetical protein
MSDERQLTGRMTDSAAPNWAPLLRVVGEELAGSFMWMFEIATSDGRRLQAYKHRHTRRYLYLDNRAGSFLYVGPDRYQRIDLAAALELALSPLWQGLRTTPEEVAVAWMAIERARRCPPSMQSHSSGD